MKNSEQCTSLQEQAVESSQTSFWDTDQSLLLSGTNTPAKSLELESQTDGSTECQCGKEMSDCSIHPNTRDEWIAFMQDSLVRTLAESGLSQVLEKIRDQAYTEKCCELQTYYDPNTCSWKTSQESSLEMGGGSCEPSLETLPRVGMMRSGRVYRLPKLERAIKGTDGGSWPTPTVADTEGGIAKDVIYQNGRYCRINKKGERWGVKLRDALGGKPNPRWTEWLMGFPIGHLKLKV